MFCEFIYNLFIILFHNQEMRKISNSDLSNRLKRVSHHKTDDWTSDAFTKNVNKTSDKSQQQTIADKEKFNVIDNIIFKNDKNKLLFAIIIYIIAFFLILFTAINDASNQSEAYKNEIYRKINHDFFNITRQFKIIPSYFNHKDITKNTLSKKIRYNLQTDIEKYPFFDVFYFAEVNLDLEKSKDNFIIHDFTMNNFKNASTYYDTYNHSISQELNALPIVEFKQGFYYFDGLQEKSAYYVIPIADNRFIFMRMNQKLFSNYYASHDFIPYFKNKIFEQIETQDNQFIFNYINNINYLFIESSNKINIYFKVFIFYFSIFLILNIIIFFAYRGLSLYYQSITQIDSLKKELKLIHKNKSSHDVRMQHLIESTNFVPWSADPKSNIFIYIGSQIVDMTGLSYETWTTSGFWLSHIHEGDRDILFKAINSLKHEMYVTAEYRIYNSFGEIMWLRNTISKATSQSPNNDTETITTLQGFMIDITDQKKILETLETAKIAAEKASKMKSNFLASMSHELRTPLNSIIGFADIINSMQGIDKNNMIKEYSDNILLSGKHLLDLINDILDYSKIEAGEFEIRLEPTPIVDIFKSCHTLLENRAKNMNISLLVKYPSEDMYINADPVRIKQVLINLLTNALKFNRPNGKVALIYEIAQDGKLIFKVTDTGIGIKPEDVQIALEKFRQVDSSKNRQQEGTGLGLSISKSLVELHGGELTLNSIYGKGTQVVLTFPASIIYHHNHYKKLSE